MLSCTHVQGLSECYSFSRMNEVIYDRLKFKPCIFYDYEETIYEKRNPTAGEGEVQGVSLCQQQLFSLLQKWGTSSQGAVPDSLPFSSQMESTNCVHRLLCRYIYCIHFQSSNQRLGFAFCPIILIFSEMGTIDPLYFTVIQTLYC